VSGLPTLNAHGMSVKLPIALAAFGRAQDFASGDVACNDRKVSGKVQKGRPPKCVRPAMCDHY
jgi:hypothetical protein